MTADHYVALILLIISVTVTAHIFIDEHRKARAQNNARPSEEAPRS